APAVAPSRVATRSTTAAGSPPTSSAPVRLASSSKEKPLRSAATPAPRSILLTTGLLLLAGAGFLLEPVEDLAGDIDLLADEHDAVDQDQIILFFFGELLHDFAHPPLELAELFVTADVEILPQLIVHAPELAVAGAQIAL